MLDENVADNVKKKKTWLWVIGWICFFPIPLTIIIARSKKMQPTLKYTLIVVLWIFVILLGIFGGDADTSTSGQAEPTTEPITETTTKSTVIFETTSKESGKEETKGSSKDAIDIFVDCFNENELDNKLEYVESFAVQERNNGHYRTEFRLTAYKDATGKSYQIGDLIVDMVLTKPVLGDPNIRLYCDDIEIEEAIQIIEISLPILDPNLTKEDIDETINELKEKKHLNGHYCGEVGVLYVGDLMLALE